MHVLLLAILLLPTAALAREESINERAARYRIFCNQQPKEHQADCHRNARDQIALERARREADEAARRKADRTNTNR